MSWQLTDANESGCGGIAPRVIWARSRRDWCSGKLWAMRPPPRSRASRRRYGGPLRTLRWRSIRQRSWPVCGGPGNGASGRARSGRLGTTTGELKALADWLMREGVTHVAMESTGVYWKPGERSGESPYRRRFSNE